MNLGIIGLPQVGKKTLFHLLTGIQAAKAPTRNGIGYAVAAVRDPRVDELTAVYKPKKTKYAEFEMALPPDVKPDAARSAEWMDPIRRVDGLIHVVRAFPGDNVFHIAGSVDPARDLGLVEIEFLLADLALVETRLDRISKEEKKKQANANLDREKHILGQFKTHLESEQSLRTLPMPEEDLKLVRSLQFLTLSPLLVVFNAGENLAEAQAALEPLAAKVRTSGATVVYLSAAIEAEIGDLSPDERQAFMTDLGITEPAAHRLSRAAFECLGLISFFTVGPDEVRAWPVRRGAKAPEAAGRVHTDMERGFIRADTVAYEDLVRAGSEKAAREANLYHLHGKDYVVQDGDVIEYRFSV